MSTVIVLGGVGAVGRVAARTLAAHDAFDRVVIADIDLDGARGLAAEMGAGVEAVRLDASDETAVEAAARGADVVLNCSGPFYRLAAPVLRAVIAAGVDYVDVCDDVDATLAQLEMDGAARAAGVAAVIGMGNSPGVTNLLAQFAAEHLLDSVEAVDIYHAHGGEAFEGAGVVAHRFHGMSMAIPVYLDGALTTVRFHEPDGVALRERVSFHLLGDGIPVYPYPHPEQITIPRHLPLRRVTNRGTVLPDEYFALTAELSRLGLDRLTPLSVAGQTVTPHDFAIAFLLHRRDEILRQTDFGTQRGCTKVVVSGLRRGGPRQYVFSMASTNQALGEGTGIPAAMGAILMKAGKAKAKGVLPPEAAFDPVDFLALVRPVLALTQQGGSFDGVVVEKVDESGAVERIDLPF